MNGTSLLANPFGPLFLRVDSAGAVYGHGIAVPESRTDQFGAEELAHHFERIDTLLQRLGRESVHQVGMHHDPGIEEVAHCEGGLFDRHPFVHQCE